MTNARGPRRLWCLNLDAEDELRRGPGYTPSRATLAAVASAREQARGLLAREDQLLDDPATDLVGHTLVGRTRAQPGERLEGAAWCPTPRALRLLAAAGATLPSAPDVGTLRRVNASRFPYDVLGARLPRACVVTQRDAAEAWLRARPSSGGVWLKRAYGAAGRGKLRVDGSPLQTHERAFLTDDELTLGVVLEPHVSITLEVSLHGHLSAAGSLALGVPCVQHVTGGRFVSVRQASLGELWPTEQAALEETTCTLARALHQEGYFGPLGVDAYRYVDEQGARRWNPCGELNARYTMGYAVGMHGVVTNK